MIFKEITPSYNLKPFINCYWYMEADYTENTGNCCERVLPDGSLEIIFHLGENIYRPKEKHRIEKEPGALLIGQTTSSYFIVPKGKVKMVGVRFYPHTASLFLNESVKQFNDSVFDLADISGNQIKCLHEKIFEADSLSKINRLLEDYFISQIKNSSTIKFSYVDYTVKYILKEKGNVSLNSFIEKLGISSRYLQELFIELMGISPKHFSKIIRFQTAVNKLINYKVQNLSQAGYDSGYFDQSHFIRDFKQFAGITPKQFKNEQLGLTLPFFSQESSSYLYNY